MKKPLLIVLIALLFTNIVTAQISRPLASSNKAKPKASCGKVYIGFGTGINYSSGLMGLNVDVPVTGSFSLGTGVGISSWGYKLYGEARYYFSPCNRGWALGTGLTLNTGLSSFQSELPTTYGTDLVTLELHKKLNAFLCGYRFWDMGKRGHRFHLQLGYSLPLSNDDYTILSGHTLDSDGVAIMDILSPGGLIFGMGFSFAIGK